MRTVLICLVAALMVGSTQALSQSSELRRADGETIFSSEFMDDRRAAETRARDARSVEPLLALLSKYNKPEEIAELELMIGQHYNQRAGMVDHAKAVEHLTRALAFRLPEPVWLQATVWRSSSLLQVGRSQDALKDALRVLVTVSYRDMSRPCPPIESPPRPASTDAGRTVGRGPPVRFTPEDAQRLQDYNRYRELIDQHRKFSLFKYHAIDFVLRIQNLTGIGEDDVRTALSEVSPDTSRPEIVFAWLKSPNPFPRCSTG